MTQCILLSGMPGSGLHTLASMATQSLEERGWHVYILDTTKWDQWPGRDPRKSQLALLHSQRELWLDLAKDEPKSVVLTIGGEPDFWGDHPDSADLVEFPYDVIIDLESPVDDVQKEQDRRRRTALSQYPHIHYLPARDDFQTKMAAGLSLLLETLAEEPVTHERKWNIQSVDWDWLRAQSLTAIELEQYYLIPQNGLERRLRKRWSQGEKDLAYYLTEKDQNAAMTRYERERRIERPLYEQLLRERDDTRAPIRKTRYCFTLQGHHAELDLFANPRNLMILEIELPDEKTQVELPFELKGVEVTGNKDFLNAHISRSILQGPSVGQTVWVSVLDPKTGPRGMQGEVVMVDGKIEVKTKDGNILFDHTHTFSDQKSIWHLHI